MNTKTEETLTFKLPELPYSADALEPYIDTRTMEIHYGKHHAGYVSNLNKAAIPAKNVSLKAILANISSFSTAVRNNGGGHYNHSFFWQILTPSGKGRPDGFLLDAINDTFGSFEEFKKLFAENAMRVFGSGWAWLVVRDEKLAIGITPNQDNPLMDVSPFKGVPVLGIDVWEHAYYLKHQNRRQEYIDDFWHVINWEEVGNRYNEALYSDEMTSL